MLSSMEEEEEEDEQQMVIGGEKVDAAVSNHFGDVDDLEEEEEEEESGQPEAHAEDNGILKKLREDLQGDEEEEEDLDMLTSLLAESGDVGGNNVLDDDLDDLFDNDGDDDVEYQDRLAEEEEEEEEEEDEQKGVVGHKEDAVVSDLFGDVDDLEEEDEEEGGQPESHAEDNGILNKSREDLQEELCRMQQKMQRLQQQLDAGRSLPAFKKRKTPPQQGSVARTPANPPPASTQKTRPPAAKPSSSSTSSSPPVRGGTPKLMESGDFSDQLINGDMFKRKPRTAHLPKPSGASPEDRGPLVEIKIGSSFQPMESTSKPRPQASASQPRPAPPPVPKDVAVEKYSGLRLRNPCVSSCEMDRKMADRRLIRLSQLPQRAIQEKLEDSDWVTFAVLISKATKQSKGSGNTFSAWTLCDLHDLEVCVTLLLFGNEHKEHWKTDVGTVIGVLNPNLMKPRDGYDGVSLSVDNPQKVLLMGVAMDYGTCKGVKKSGEPCSKIVNMYECQYCQYHVTAQYKKMSSKRAELQSSYSGKAPGKVKGKGGGGLKERLCQGGFYYGGVGVSKPNKSTQRTLDTLFVKGAAKLVDEAKRLVVQSGEVSGCSDDFKSLMSQPTPGALQLKKHLLHAKPSGSVGGAGGGLQSISASDLLKQQKKKQQELLESRRRRRADEIQKLALQNSSAGVPSLSPRVPASSPSVSGSSPSVPGSSPSVPGSSPRVPGSSPRVPASRGPAGALLSPRAACKVPNSPAQSSPAPRAPTLGRGFSEDEEILFFDHSPPQARPPAPSLSVAKMAALRRLKAKGAGLAKEDPNAMKRKRSGGEGCEISARVEKNLAAVQGGEPADAEGEEDGPAQKRKRDLSYIQSEEFQKILNAKSRHQAALQARSTRSRRATSLVLVKKEQLEDKMRETREMKCRAVSCKKCNYTYFKPARPPSVARGTTRLNAHDAGSSASFKLSPAASGPSASTACPTSTQEKKGPKIAGELLQPRGEEQPKFLTACSEPADAEGEEDGPAQKRKRDLSYIQSEEFQKILNAKSRHQAALQAAEYQIQESYFAVLVKKEQLEDKMRETREMKCRAVSCKKVPAMPAVPASQLMCNYTYFKPADRCVEGNHALKWHDAVKRFFNNCGLFKWQRDGMLKEKKGPKIAGELLQPRGEEQPKFLNSMQ
ncbi:hypothetical protein CRUP_030220 [Coryphaenoides rupestris]|nr:hypothetical protein CRUP_030220 [Coryphaenoides rupestris]